MNDMNSRVADAIDRGLIPWRLCSGLPRNIVTRKFYGGVTPILLEIAAGTLGCSSPWWGTLKEWESVSGKVRPDSLGARIPYWQETVYNLEQTDRGYEPPAPFYDDPAPVFDALVRGAGIAIEYVFNAECKYFGAEDKIRMPHKWMFEIGPGGVSGYYDALGHEIFHWSESRLHWDASADVLSSADGQGARPSAMAAQNSAISPATPTRAS